MAENKRPFSNGTEAMDWYCNNCETCVKAWHPDPKKGSPSYETMKKYRSQGKYCPLQFDIDDGFVSGEIPTETYRKIWPMGRMENPKCFHWSGDDRDRWTPPRKPKPVPPPNQLPLFTEFDELVKPIEKVK